MYKILAVQFLLLSTYNCWTFGRIGHRTVAEIASRHIKTSTLIETKRLLDGRSLAMVANWPDEIRDDAKWKHTIWWHFVNVEDNQTYEVSKKNPKGDIVQTILRFEKLLSNSKSDSEKAEALKWLIHLVGDLHQPLHVGRSQDHGGNKVQVNWMGFPSNLHKVWDEHLIQEQRLSFTEMSDFLNFYTKDEIKRWQADDITVWLKESFDLRKEVYKIGNRSLNYDYYGRCVPIINKRIRQAGIRLAALLDKAISP